MERLTVCGNCNEEIREERWHDRRGVTEIYRECPFCGWVYHWDHGFTDAYFKEEEKTT